MKNAGGRGRFGLLAGLAAILLLAPAPAMSLAVFTGSDTVVANVEAGHWAHVIYYLHDNPTPPRSPRDAQANLTMDTTLPTAGALQPYSAPTCYASAGRLLSTDPNPAICRRQNWLTGPLPPTIVAGAVTLTAYLKLQAETKGAVGIDIALNDVIGTSRTNIAGVTKTTCAVPAGSGFTACTFTLTVGSYTVAANHQIELVLTGNSAGTHGNDSAVIAYDTSAYRASLRLTLG